MSSVAEPSFHPFGQSYGRFPNLSRKRSAAEHCWECIDTRYSPFSWDPGRERLSMQIEQPSGRSTWVLAYSALFPQSQV